ncbi:DIL domain-containing protein [Pyronema domesticum]|uniref:Similar to Dilute domain-containing protein C25B8.08 acc. no. Q9UTB0 n=1 Tax=Pyronema omphalodes (strain CBS 100304) TaxID=1076935 RepID=U4LV60_PYROM|nr:DIL domain-containing protein [Pyronema domesticum]CCX32256.1 Similar to Dilute domain-containing protein C25B8.08; acc. no. Q9UTB0 [Pyronema omphalodes CBS 100304]
MDLGDLPKDIGFDAGGDLGDLGPSRTRQLPADLPTSLNDRRLAAPVFTETEVYDGWQGESTFITAPVPARLDFNIGFRDDDEDADVKELAESERRLESMMAQQAAFRLDGASMNDDEIATSKAFTEQEKKDLLQKALNMAASNGEDERVRKLLNGESRKFININLPDEEGTSPLIYASCFGHEDVVEALIKAGADVDQQDKNNWSSLMWAMTNRHKSIIKLLLENGASPEVKSSNGRTAFDFVEPQSEISGYLHANGYIGSTGAGALAGGFADDFYSSGLAQDRFEEEMAENELRRRMMMESAVNLEVDLSSLGLDEQAEQNLEEDEEEEEGQEFLWDRCLPDQMFVFQEQDLDRTLDIVITNMTPQRSPSQKPVPANILFLGARYAHYHSTPDLLSRLLVTSMKRINDTVEKHQWDMTMLAFWLSNATLLLYYLKKDAGLVSATTQFQQQLSELINEIFVLIIRDAERRMDKVLDTAMLEHETIPGFEDVQFQNEWRLFKSKKKSDMDTDKQMRPPSPKQRAKPAPRNITSLLSSTLFVLDLYDIHSVITAQVLSQLFYWLGAELFNRILNNRKYLCRTKAMQIRLNVSALEDWARTNNRQPEHYDAGSLSPSGEDTIGSARRHLAPVIQLLQWLQCFSSVGEDIPELKAIIDQMPRLTSQQIHHSVKNYRPEVGEKMLSKEATKFLVGLTLDFFEKKHKRRSTAVSIPSTPISWKDKAPTSPKSPESMGDDDDAPSDLLMDQNMMLPFQLPTSTDMLVSYGAGIGGMNVERARKFWPSVPPEFLTRLDFSGGGGGG